MRCLFYQTQMTGTCLLTKQTRALGRWGCLPRGNWHPAGVAVAEQSLLRSQAAAAAHSGIELRDHSVLESVCLEMLFQTATSQALWMPMSKSNIETAPTP
jgi:hypothetical protein